MIKPNNIITTTPQVLDGLFVTSISILAPNPLLPIQATIRIAPYNTTSSYIARQEEKKIPFTDIISASIQYPCLVNVINVIEDAVQQLVVSMSLFSTTSSLYNIGTPTMTVTGSI